MEVRVNNSIADRESHGKEGQNMPAITPHIAASVGTMLGTSGSGMEAFSCRVGTDFESASSYGVITAKLLLHNQCGHALASEVSAPIKSNAYTRLIVQLF